MATFPTLGRCSHCVTVNKHCIQWNRWLLCCAQYLLTTQSFPSYKWWEKFQNKGLIKKSFSENQSCRCEYRSLSQFYRNSVFKFMFFTPATPLCRKDPFTSEEKYLIFIISDLAVRLFYYILVQSRVTSFNFSALESNAIIIQNLQFLRAFAKFRKTPVSCDMSVCLSVVVTREWRRLHNELCDLYSPNIRVINSRTMRWAGHVALQSRGAYRSLVGRSEGRRPLGKSKRRWEDNIKMDLQEVGWKGMD